MIIHKIDSFKTPSKHIETVPMSKKEYVEIQRLLDIRSFELWSDEKKKKYNVVPDSMKWIFDIKFDDGAELDWRLCSGQNNYFDDVLFTYPTGEVTVLDCSFEIDDIEINTEIDIYIVRLDIQDE